MFNWFTKYWQFSSSLISEVRVLQSISSIIKKLEYSPISKFFRFKMIWNSSFGKKTRDHILYKSRYPPKNGHRNLEKKTVIEFRNWRTFEFLYNFCTILESHFVKVVKILTFLRNVFFVSNKNYSNSTQLYI